MRNASRTCRFIGRTMMKDGLKRSECTPSIITPLLIASSTVNRCECEIVVKPGWGYTKEPPDEQTKAIRQLCIAYAAAYLFCRDRVITCLWNVRDLKGILQGNSAWRFLEAHIGYFQAEKAHGFQTFHLCILLQDPTYIGILELLCIRNNLEKHFKFKVSWE